MIGLPTEDGEPEKLLFYLTGKSWECWMYGLFFAVNLEKTCER